MFVINALQTEQNVRAASGKLNDIPFNPIRVIAKYFHRGKRADPAALTRADSWCVYLELVEEFTDGQTGQVRRQLPSVFDYSSRRREISSLSGNPP